MVNNIAALLLALFRAFPVIYDLFGYNDSCSVNVSMPDLGLPVKRNPA
jgi:hypothetical protein